MAFEQTIREALQALEVRASLIPGGFGVRKPMTAHFQGSTFRQGRWVVTRAPMLVPGFNLLDATVRQKLELGAEGAVAVLVARPNVEGIGPEVDERYLRRFQTLVWSAFRVVWILDAGALRHSFKLQAAETARDTKVLLDAIEVALGAFRLPRRPRNNREAQRMVRPIVDRVLAANDFRQEESRRYRGFWRWPTADGLWLRGTRAPCRFGLEVGLRDDFGCPLSQPAEALGYADAMAQVTVAASAADEREVVLSTRAKNALEHTGRMRYMRVGITS